MLYWLRQMDTERCKTINAAHGCQILLDKIGGFTQQVRNPDSWEGWYWGAKHVWGEADVGMMDPQTNVIKDVTENSELLLFWGCDPETTTWGFVGQMCQLGSAISGRRQA